MIHWRTSLPVFVALSMVAVSVPAQPSKPSGPTFTPDGYVEVHYSRNFNEPDKRPRMDKSIGTHRGRRSLGIDKVAKM